MARWMSAQMSTAALTVLFVVAEDGVVGAEQSNIIMTKGRLPIAVGVITLDSDILRRIFRIGILIATKVLEDSAARLRVGQENDHKGPKIACPRKEVTKRLHFSAPSPGYHP